MHVIDWLSPPCADQTIRRLKAQRSRRRAMKSLSCFWYNLS